MSDILNDTSTYKKENINLTATVQKSVTVILLKWCRSGEIDSGTKNKLTCYNGHLTRIYGLPKVYKPNIPLESIGSSFHAPTNSLSNL